MLLLFLFLTLFATTAKAQGFYTCMWDGSECTTINSCEPVSNYIPGNECASLGDSDSCNGQPSKQCLECGQEGQPCCINGPQCSDYSYCNTSSGNICAACGRPGQTCCPLGANPYECETNSECFNGNCQTINMETSPPSPPSSPAPPVYECGGSGSFDTAIGCINYSDLTLLATFILSWSLGIGGGIFILLSAYAGFLIMTSSGNPRRLKAGQELLTSAFAGLIMLIFSAFILRFIGVNLFGIFT